MANQTLAEALKTTGNRFRHVAADGSRWAVEKQHAMTVINGNKDLRRADPLSLAQAVLQAASMGLTLNPSAGLCYLIPRRARRMRQGENRAEYERDVRILAYASPSYKGLVAIARAQGVVQFVGSDVIFDADTFTHKGAFSYPEHVIDIRSKKREENDAIGVYCCAILQGGGVLTEYMDRETVLKIRAMSEFPGGAMWDPRKLWTQGWRKAVIRRAWNSWPKAAEGRMGVATEVLNTYEGISVEEPTGGPEAVALIGESQLMDLHAILTDHDRTTPERDLKRLAERFGHGSIEELPLAEFASAKEVLKASMARMLGGGE